MANEYLNPVDILQESLMSLENNLVLFKSINREYSDSFAVAGAKVGYTINARLPVRFRGRKGDEINPEDIREQMVPITVDSLWGVDLDISDQDLTMTIDKFRQRYIERAVQTIANNIDADCFDTAYRDIYNFAGVPGTTPTALSTYTDAGVILSDHAVPVGRSRAVVVSPRMEAAVLGFNSNIFNPTKEISRQYEEGTMGYAVGFKWSTDQNVPRHVVGLMGGTPAINGANQSGSSLTTDGWSNSVQVLNRGDIISIAGVNGVNPISYRDTGVLRTFVVTADVTSDGSGNATIPISPALNANDATGRNVFQTVTALPADNALINVFGKAAANQAAISGVSTAQALAFDRDFMTLATVDLELPGGLDWSERISSSKIGLSMRLTRGFDIKSNHRYTRLEILGGIKVLRPEMAVRICG